MTVKELLDSLLFDEIAPYITKRYERCEDADSVLPTISSTTTICAILSRQTRSE